MQNYWITILFKNKKQRKKKNLDIKMNPNLKFESKIKTNNHDCSTHFKKVTS